MGLTAAGVQGLEGLPSKIHNLGLVEEVETLALCPAAAAGFGTTKTPFLARTGSLAEQLL